MSNKLTGILIDVNVLHNSGVVEIENKLETFYELLNCDTIDIVHRKIGNKSYDIICDDEALLKDGAKKLSYIEDEGDIDTGIIGNILIFNFNGVDDEASLDERDIDNIKHHMAITFDDKHNFNFLVIGNKEWR